MSAKDDDSKAKFATSNIFETMFSMLDEKPKGEKQSVVPSSSDKKTKPEANCSVSGKDKSSQIIPVKDHKSAINKFAFNLSKLSFNKNKSTISKVSEESSDQDARHMSPNELEKLSNEDGNESGEDMNMDDFMILDEASSSDGETPSKIKNSNNMKTEQSSVLQRITSTPIAACVTNTVKSNASLKEISVSPIRKSSGKASTDIPPYVGHNSSKETDYSDVTSDESGELHSGGNEAYSDISDEEDLFKNESVSSEKRANGSSEMTYNELLSKEPKSKPFRERKELSKKTSPKELMEQFITEQRKIVSTKLKNAESETLVVRPSHTRKITKSHKNITVTVDYKKSESSTNHNGSMEVTSLVNSKPDACEKSEGHNHLRTVSGAKLNFSDEITKKSKPQPANITETTGGSKSLSKESNVTCRGYKNSNNESESLVGNINEKIETSVDSREHVNEYDQQSLSPGALIVVDEAGPESSDPEENASEDEQFEVIDSCLDVDEEDEAVDKDVIGCEEQPQENLTNDESIAHDSEDSDVHSNCSLSNVMVIDEVCDEDAEQNTEAVTDVAVKGQVVQSKVDADVEIKDEKAMLKKSREDTGLLSGGIPDQAHNKSSSLLCEDGEESSNCKEDELLSLVLDNQIKKDELNITNNDIDGSGKDEELQSLVIDNSKESHSESTSALKFTKKVNDDLSTTMNVRNYSITTNSHVKVKNAPATSWKGIDAQIDKLTRKIVKSLPNSEEKLCAKEKIQHPCKPDTSLECNFLGTKGTSSNPVINTNMNSKSKIVKHDIFGHQYYETKIVVEKNENPTSNKDLPDQVLESVETSPSQTSSISVKSNCTNAEKLHLDNESKIIGLEDDLADKSASDINLLLPVPHSNSGSGSGNDLPEINSNISHSLKKISQVQNIDTQSATNNADHPIDNDSVTGAPAISKLSLPTRACDILDAEVTSDLEKTDLPKCESDENTFVSVNHQIGQQSDNSHGNQVTATSSTAGNTKIVYVSTPIISSAIPSVVEKSKDSSAEQTIKIIQSPSSKAVTIVLPEYQSSTSNAKPFSVLSPTGQLAPVLQGQQGGTVQTQNNPTSPTVKYVITVKKCDRDKNGKPINKSVSSLLNSNKISLLHPPPLQKYPSPIQNEASLASLETANDIQQLPILSSVDSQIQTTATNVQTSLVKYHDITGSQLLKTKDEKSSQESSANGAFKILKVSDSVLEEKPTKKKRVRTKKPKVVEKDGTICAYPVDYRKSEEEKKTSMIKKKVGKNTARKTIASNSSSKPWYMPQQEKLEDFRGRFLVGIVNGTYICFKCKSKFLELKYFRWHLWYHIHLHSEQCPTCDSQNPLGDCSTTDNLLQTVARLENEQILFVLTPGENDPIQPPCDGVNYTSLDKLRHQPGMSASLDTNQSYNTPSVVADNNKTDNVSKAVDTSDTCEQIDEHASDGDDSFMGLKILNTFSLTDVDATITASLGENSENNQVQEYQNQPASQTVDTVPNQERSSSPLCNENIFGNFYKCTLCDFSSLFPGEFESHVYSIHINAHCFKCYYCDFETLGGRNYVNHYTEHVKSVREDSVFSCTYQGCEEKVNRLDQHLKHLETHENLKPQCCQCSIEFQTFAELLDHYKKFLISLFSCQYCDAKAVDKKSYLQHVSQVHSLKARMVMVRKTLVCSISDSVNQASSIVSEDSQTPKKLPPLPQTLSPQTDVCFSTFICQKCSFVCNSKSEFLNHKKAHNSPDSIPLSLPFTCPSCPCAFNTVNELWSHLDYHDEVIEFYLYKCPVDDFTTNDFEKGKLHCTVSNHFNAELVKVSVILHKNNIHHCKLCGIKVKEREIFLRHLLIHGRDGEKIAKTLHSPQKKPIKKLNFSPTKSPHVKKGVSKSSTKPLQDKPTCTLAVKSNSILSSQTGDVSTKTHLEASTPPENSEPFNAGQFLQKITGNKAFPIVTNPVNMVVQASPSYRYSAQILDQKLKVLYTHKSGFFVCSVCQSLFRVKNLLSNHIVEHLDMPYQCCKCGHQTHSYDLAIAHALKSHNMEQINIIYSEAINDKITKIAQTLKTKKPTVSPAAREEFSKRVNFLRQQKTFQSGNKVKPKVFTSSMPSSSAEFQAKTKDTDKTIDEQGMEMACKPMSAKDSEKMAFLQEEETNTALMKLFKEGSEYNWCKICSKPFSRSSWADISFKDHVLTHLNYTPYQCNSCSFTAYSSKSFSVHCRTRHAGLNFVVEERKMADIVEDFIKTKNICLNSNHEDRSYTAEDGEPRFTSQPSTSSKVTSYICEICTQEFDCPFKLLRHKKMAHLRPSSNTARKSTTQGPENIRDLLRLTSVNQTQKQCARKSTGNIKQKENNCIPEMRQFIPEKPVVQKYVCQKCDYVTEKKKRSMIYHFKKHGFECFVECNNCQAKYTSMRLLLKHFELIHKGKELHPKYLPIESYFVPISEAEIKLLKARKETSGPADNLVTSNNQLPPFICVFCKLEEMKEDYMRYHLYIHLDYKPYKCGDCSMAFSDPFQQKLHLNNDHTKKVSGIFDKILIYENKVTEILNDCRRSIQTSQSFNSWNLDDVQRDLLTAYMNPDNWGIRDDELKESKALEEEIDIKPDPIELLKKSSKQTLSFVSGNSFHSEGSSYDSELPDLDVDIKPSNKRKTMSLADYAALKRKSDSKSEYTEAKKPKTVSNNATKKKNLIESVFGVHGREAKKKSQPVKRSSELCVEASDNKKAKYSGDFDTKVILCYYCSFMSESISAVIDHTHDEHLGGKRKAGGVGMLWVDTITGGTYDFEGNVFSTGFDTDITIEFPYLCGVCNFRALEVTDVHNHEQVEHPNMKSAKVYVIKKPKVSSGRGRSTVSYSDVSRRKPVSSNSVKSKSSSSKSGKSATNSSSPNQSSTLDVSSTSLDSSGASIDAVPVKSGRVDTSYRCSKCDCVSNTEYLFRLHLASHKSFKCLVPDFSKNPHLKCEICCYRAPDAEKFTKHMVSHNGPSVKFICGFCGFNATSTRAIKMHHKKKHPTQNFDITKFVDKKSPYKNLSLLVDLNPQVNLENILEMSQKRFKYILNSGNISFEN